MKGNIFDTKKITGKLSMTQRIEKKGEKHFKYRQLRKNC